MLEWVTQMKMKTDMKTKIIPGMEIKRKLKLRMEQMLKLRMKPG
jgi:hypothetical protein